MVPKYRRSQSKFDAIVKADRLFDEILRIAQVKNLCPPKLSNAVRIPLMNDARELLNDVTVANSLDLRIEWQRNKRQQLQSDALHHLIMLANDLNLCIKISKTPKGLMGAFQLISDERQLIRAWMKSDDSRVSKMNEDNSHSETSAQDHEQISPGKIPGTDVDVLSQLSSDEQNSNDVIVKLDNNSQTLDICQLISTNQPDNQTAIEQIPI